MWASSAVFCGVGKAKGGGNKEDACQENIGDIGEANMELRERLGTRTFDRLDARDCGQMIVADDLFEGALDLSLGFCFFVRYR